MITYALFIDLHIVFRQIFRNLSNGAAQTFQLLSESAFLQTFLLGATALLFKTSRGLFLCLAPCSAAHLINDFRYPLNNVERGVAERASKREVESNTECIHSGDV